MDGLETWDRSNKLFNCGFFASGERQTVSISKNNVIAACCTIGGQSAKSLEVDLRLGGHLPFSKKSLRNNAQLPAGGMGIMKRTIWALVALLASTSVAGAADVPVASSFDWSGAYIGLNASYAFSGNDVNVESVGPDPFPQDEVLANLGTNAFDLDSDGFVGGAQIGYNWQMDGIVLGIEADAQYTDVSGSDTELNGGDGFRGSQELDYLATLRARLGLAVSDGFLFLCYRRPCRWQGGS